MLFWYDNNIIFTMSYNLERIEKVYIKRKPKKEDVIMETTYLVQDTLGLYLALSLPFIFLGLGIFFYWLDYKVNNRRDK